MHNTECSPLAVWCSAQKKQSKKHALYNTLRYLKVIWELNLNLDNFFFIPLPGFVSTIMNNYENKTV